MRTGVKPGLARVLKSPSNAERRRKGKGHFIFSPNSGMHQTLVQKRSEQTLFRTRGGTASNNVSHRATDCFGALAPEPDI